MEEQVKKDDIRGAFIKKDGNLKVSLVIPTDLKGRIINEKRNVDRQVMPHESLRRAMKSLLPHAVTILWLAPKGSAFDEKYLKTRKVHSDTSLKEYTLVGFEVKGKDDDPQVILIVRKNVFGEKTIDIKTPPIRTHGNKVAYPFSGILDSDLDELLEEVLEYIQGKYYDSDQIEIAHTSDEDEDEEIF